MHTKKEAIEVERNRIIDKLLDMERPLAMKIYNIDQSGGNSLPERTQFNLIESIIKIVANKS